MSHRFWRRGATATVIAVSVGAAFVAADPVASADSAVRPLPASVTAVMDKPQYAQAAWGLLELDANSGRQLYAKRAGEMFIPGSTAKLFSVSGVWRTLGPDTRFHTPVYALGTRAGGKLAGNLVLVGSGDLTLGGRTKPDGTVDYTNLDHTDADAIPGATLTPEDPLAGIKSLASQVKAAGVSHVNGNVVIDDRLFTATFHPTPTPVIINDNLIDVLATPTRAGQPATVATRPPAASYTVRSSVTTTAAGTPTSLHVSGSAPGTITVTGSIAADAAPALQVAPITDPASFARTALIEALTAAGVQVDADPAGANPSNLLPAQNTYPADGRLAEYVSPVYAEYAKLILKVSHNLGANLGICLLAVHAASHDCDAGFPVLHTFLNAAGVDSAGVALADGRGGDPTDRATPVAVTQMLRYWTREPDFARWRATLPILGVDGSLAGNAVHTAARGKVFAKTGSAIAGDPLSEQYLLQAKALAGYLQAANGRWRVFDVVVNNAGGAPDLNGLFAAGEDLAQISAQLWQKANPSSPTACSAEPTDCG
jgi:D-alanyl-D-alanine carboxypeptidase/D-alanyl-D-alanine-endopeptidase (penicillin-binding protein 4)